MSEQATMIFRIDADLKRAFDMAAKDLDRTASQMLRDYVRAVVAEHAKTHAQRTLELSPPPIIKKETPEAREQKAKAKKGQKLAAAKPANWRPQ